MIISRRPGWEARECVYAFGLDADMCLASAFAKLRELGDTPDMLIVERRQIVLEIKLEISEVRRMLAELLALKE